MASDARFEYGGPISTGNEVPPGPGAAEPAERAAPGALSAGAVIATAALVLLLLSGRGFWDPDEPRFAQVAREMLRSGDWVVPRFVGEPLALLPPLTYWGSAAASLPLGDVVERTARIPVVVFALLALAAAMVLAREAGALAALVLLSSAKFLHQAQYLQADMLLVGAQTWALAAFFRSYTAERSRGAWLVSAYLAVAAGVLAKGPLGALLPAAVFGIFLGVERDLGALRRLGLAWGIPLVAACVLPWYAGACARAGEAFCRELLVKHNFGMFFDTWSHARPVWFYVRELPWMFLPWTLLLPWALRDRARDRETRFLLTWAAFAFVFFSAADAKQAKYLLPMLPPLAVLVARWLARGDRARMLRPVGVALAAVLVVAAALGAALLPARVPGAATGVVATGLASAGCFALAAWSRGSGWRAPGLFAAAMLAGALGLSHGVAPAWDAFKLPTELTRAAAARGAPLAIHGISYRQTGGLVYYSPATPRLLRSREELDAWLAAPEPRLVYVSREDWNGAGRVVAESPYRDGTLLVSNRVEEEP